MLKVSSKGIWQCILSANYGPGTVLDTGDSLVNKIGKRSLQGVFIIVNV